MPGHHESTAFVGRDETLNMLASLVDGGARLVTLTGPPGMGKTRAAARFIASRNMPAWWCDLTEARTIDDVVGMVASTIGAPLPPAITDAVGHAGRVLSSEKRVLVLDNFEQVAFAAAATVGVWLRLAPGVTFLVTSRERLQLPAEHAVTLPPLALPEGRSLDDARRSAAVHLFTLRAARVGAGFELTERNAADVTDIVRKLDGIPLAIELAAARMGVMTPAEASARLGARFDLLASTEREVPARHRTLRAALDWSWSLLTPVEQRALACCSVFKGTFTLDACEAVIGRAGTVDVIQALVDKSLIARVPSSRAQRFRLFVSIAEHAAEKLGAETEEVSRRWRAWVLDRARPLAEELDTHRDADAVEELALEQENLVHIVRDAEARGDEESALHAVLALDPLLSRRGPFDLHAALLDAAIALAKRETALLARALEARGRVRQHRGRLDECAHDLERAYAIASHVGDPGAAARALAELGALHRRRGNTAEAHERLMQAWKLVDTRSDQRLAGRIRGELGILHKEQGDLGEARTHYEDALRMLRSTGDRRHEGRVLGDLGALHQEEGRLLDARACFEGALRIHQAGGNRRFEALTWCDLGSLSLEENRPVDAAQQLLRAVHILDEIGDRRTSARFEGILAAALAMQGKLDEAAARFAQSEDELARLGDALFLAAVRIHRGHLDVAQQRIEIARQRLAEGTQGEPSPGELSDDVRFAMRVLGRALQPFSRTASGLTVGPACRWFTTPEGERVDLANRRTPARLLEFLVEKRLASPGVAIEVEALIAGGWPGERIAPDAALNRLHVTLATLRKLGLRKVLQRVDGGYLLDPAIPVGRHDA